MNFDKLFAQHASQLADFWGRREAAVSATTEITILGRRILLQSNDARVFAALDQTVALYSQTPPSPQPPFTIQFVVHAGSASAAVAPNDLMQRITYIGEGNWLMLHLADWGMVHIDLVQFRATAVLAPTLAARPDLISQTVLNTILLNFFIASGMGMLHASCLYRDGQALLLLGAHNVGKSTTSLRLALAGYPLLTDSMVFVAPANNGLLNGRLHGFPVGKTKLRQDMVPAFPHLQPHLQPEVVRNEVKYSLNLREVSPALVWETAVVPQTVTLCLLSRHDEPDTLLTPATPEQVWSAIMQNSLYYDKTAVWQRNLSTLAPLIARANLHHLCIGHDEANLLATVSELFSS